MGAPASIPGMPNIPGMPSMQLPTTLSIPGMPPLSVPPLNVTSAGGVSGKSDIVTLVVLKVCITTI